MLKKSLENLCETCAQKDDNDDNEYENNDGNWSRSGHVETKINKLWPLFNWVNDTPREKLNSVIEFVKIKPWLLLTYSICLHNLFHNFIIPLSYN